MRLRLPSPLTLFGAGLVLLVATAAILWIVPSDYYVFLPDNAKPVAPLVSVQGGKDPSGDGGMYYDAVIVRRAKLFEQLFHFVHEGETLVKADQVNPPGTSDQQAHVENLREMATSQQIAGAVALKQLGYKVVVQPRGALIEDVAPGSPAAKANLEPTEIIETIDGKRVQDDGRRAPADGGAPARATGCVWGSAPARASRPERWGRSRAAPRGPVGRNASPTRSGPSSGSSSRPPPRSGCRSR